MSEDQEFRRSLTRRELENIIDDDNFYDDIDVSVSNEIDQNSLTHRYRTTILQ